MLRELNTKYLTMGAASGQLGAPRAAQVALTVGGISGTYQDFEGGMLISSNAVGTYAVLHGPIRAAWGGRGGVNGSLGWPIGDQHPTSTGIEQQFQGGVVSVLRDGTVLVLDGPIGSYMSSGSNSTLLGPPVGRLASLTAQGITGLYQNFERGLVVSSEPTGTFAVLNGGIRSTWGALGGTGGRLGWPIGELQTVAGVVTQSFQFGTITVSASDVAGILDGPILDYWRSGAHAIVLGAPLGSPSALTSHGVTGAVQNFEHGMVLSSATTGTFAVLHGAVRSEWGARGGTSGALGWPTGDQESRLDGSVRQQFQGGTVTGSLGPAISGDIGTYWSSGANAVKLGSAIDIASPLMAGGISGVLQNFERGMVLSSPVTGTFAVLNGPVRGAWGALGGTGGALGWPRGDQTPIPDGGVDEGGMRKRPFQTRSKGLSPVLKAELENHRWR